MNRMEHLLTILTEECAEVQQAVTKTLRFGLKEGKYADTPNEERIRAELNDLLAVVEMLEKEGLDLSPDHQARATKKERVENFLLYSQRCGTLTP